MGLLPNITSESVRRDIEAEKAAEQAPKKKPQLPTNQYSEKNYLNLTLGENEKSRTLEFRPLPMDLTTGSAFKIVHYHSIKVAPTVKKHGGKYKAYICNETTDGIYTDKFEKRCPFCDLSRMALQDSRNSKTDEEKKANYRISMFNLPKDAVIMRGIERGKENEGVKFLMIKLRDDKTDIYHQILDLCALRAAEGQRRGIETNILDLYNGKDLTFKITEGNAAPIVSDAGYSSPLSEDENLMREWVYDPKKWQDVFTSKTYEYLQLIMEGKTPWFDTDAKLWVDEEEYKARQKAKQDANNDAARNAEAVITGGTATTGVRTVPTVHSVPTVRTVPSVNEAARNAESIITGGTYTTGVRPVQTEQAIPTANTIPSVNNNLASDLPF